MRRFKIFVFGVSECNMPVICMSHNVCYLHKMLKLPSVVPNALLIASFIESFMYFSLRILCVKFMDHNLWSLEQMHKFSFLVLRSTNDQFCLNTNIREFKIFFLMCMYV